MMPSKELELVLLRHGMTQWNAERRYLGQTDLSLLPGSLDSLSQLKEQTDLKGDFWRVYSSDLLRCRETLDYLVPSLSEVAINDKRLREMNFGDWEGCTYEQLKDNKRYRSWLDEPWAITPPNGESWEAFEGRVDEFLNELLQTVVAKSETALLRQSPRRVLVVTHGGVIRQLQARTGDLTFQEAVAPPPGTVTVLRVKYLV